MKTKTTPYKDIKYPSFEAKEPERQEIKGHIDAFLATGGVIHHIPADFMRNDIPIKSNVGFVENERVY